MKKIILVQINDSEMTWYKIPSENKCLKIKRIQTSVFRMGYFHNNRLVFFEVFNIIQ